MGAPVGNQFWKLRSKHGRDKLFATPELMWQAACEYFEWCDQNPFEEQQLIKRKISREEERIEKPNVNKMRPYTIHGLCLYLDCNVQYFNDFDNSIKCKDDKISFDFSAVIKRIREIIYNQKFSGAASGFFNPNIIARDLGLADKSELTGVNGKDLIPAFDLSKLTDKELLAFNSLIDKANGKQ